MLLLLLPIKPSVDHEGPPFVGCVEILLLLKVPLTDPAILFVAVTLPFSFKPHLPSRPMPLVNCKFMFVEISEGERGLFQILTSSIFPLKKPAGVPVELSAEPMEAYCLEI